MASQSRTPGAATPSNLATSKSFTDPWRLLWAFIFGLLLTAVFFRSVLPRLPRILFRGKLRIKRVGLRGIRGIEYRSKGFHNDSAAFSRHEDQLEVKVQKVYASFHLPPFLCKAKDQPSVVPRRSGAIITVHVQGIGVRLPRSKHGKQRSPAATTHDNASTDSLSSVDTKESLTLEEEEELRLRRLMRSPSLSPSAEQTHRFSDDPSQPLRAPTSYRSRTTNSIQGEDPQHAQGSVHRAGAISLNSFLSLASWVRFSAIPTFKSFLLRAFRAALFLLTSGLPVLTSLVSIEIDRVEVYLQEAEAVARVARAGITFTMSPDAITPDVRSPKESRAAQQPDNTSRYFRAPTLSQFCDAMRKMPTKVNSGARGAVGYLVAGMSPSAVAMHLRVDSVDLFEANFKPDVKLKHASALASRRNSNAQSSRPSTPLRQARADRGFMSPSQSGNDLNAVGDDTSTYDDSYDWCSRPSHPFRARSNSASHLSKMSSSSLRGFADRWADWALEPLVDSDFHADSGWTRQHLDAGFQPHQLQTIPSSARIVSISGVTEFTASLLVGSDFALGGDGTLAGRLTFGNIAIGLDAAHRMVCIVEERKARRTGWAPTKHGMSNNQRSVLSKHLVQQKPSAAAAALRAVSSFSLFLPSIRVTASSDALLSSADSHTREQEQSLKPSSLPSREMAVSLSGFHFELKNSDPHHLLHRRWLGTCGVPVKSRASKHARGKEDDSANKAHNQTSKGISSHSSKALEHRRTFLVEMSLASFEVHCGSRGHSRDSQLLFIGDFSLVARSSWTPFGLFSSSPEYSRLIMASDPNEHAAAIEASIGGIESDIAMEDVAALLPIANELSRQRQKKRERIGIDESPRPKTDVERLRRLPRIAAGFHIQRISLILDASQVGTDESNLPQSQQAGSRKQYSSRKLTLSVPDVDFVFFGDYRDEYVKRPLAEKRSAYKALKSDTLEWPISGKTSTEASGQAASANKQPEGSRLSTNKSNESDSKAKPAPSEAPSKSSRYTEMNLTMEEVLKRMNELQQQKRQDEDRPAATERRPSLRETMSKTGKVRLPGYSRRSSLAAETRFSLRYQFETCLRVDAVESFLSLSSDPEDSSRSFLRQPSSQTTSDVGTTQHHLLAMHSFEVHGSGKVPGNVEPRSTCQSDDIPWLSAKDTVAEFRANIEDVDIEAWHSSAFDTYADIAATFVQAKRIVATRNQTPETNGADAEDVISSKNDRKSGQNDDQFAEKPEPKPLVERLPSGIAIYTSIGRIVAHIGGPDRRIKDDIARGMGFEAERVVFEYAAVTETKSNAMTQKTNWGARTALELSEDLHLQAMSLANRLGRVASARIVLHQAGIFPILDARMAMQQHMEGTASETFAHAKAPKGEAWPKDQPEEERPAKSLLADSVWKFNKGGENIRQTTQHRPRVRQQDRSNFIFFMPYAAFKAVVRPPQAESKSGLVGTSEDEVTITAENTNLLAFKIDLLHTYCILLAIATFKNLARRAKNSVPTAEAPSSPKEEAEPTEEAKPATKHRAPSVSCRFDIKEVHVFVTLPKSTRIFMRIRRLEVRNDRKNGLIVSTESIMGAVESPKQPDRNVWEEAVRMRDWGVRLPPKQQDKKRDIFVTGDAAMIRIPYGYVVSPIIDNTSVAIKATKQLVYQFLKDRDDSIITPYGEDPKLLPNIHINVRVLTIEAEDDPFETKLNLIWRAGFAENIAREERDAAFVGKAEAISASKMPPSSASFRTSRSDESIYSDVASIRSESLDDASSTTSQDTRFTGAKAGHVSYEEARAALDAFNSSSWVRRYTNAQSEQSRRQEKVLKNIYGRLTLTRSYDDLPLNVIPCGKAAPLFRSTMYRVNLNVGQAHCPVDKLRDFIHEKGAGMPKETPFSLLLPMHMKWEMDEWRITLRDYPLPMLHIPPTHRSEKDPRKAWCFEGDIIIAEQLGGPESIRHVPAVIVPAATGRPDAIEYGMVIPKVAMSVKLYGTPTVKLQTPFPTRLVWGQSIQPAIQDFARVVDGITPPPHDPSPKLPFWDKLPLIMHGHVNIKLEDEGGFNIHLKGSRDPYNIEGQAAGWVMSWKGGVELRIGYDNPEKEFFQILSDTYVLAIPDLCDYVDHAATGTLGGGQYYENQQNHPDGDESYHDSYDRKSVNASVTTTMRRYMKDPTFRKIVIKLTNGVRWGSGLHGERTCDDETCPRRPKCKGEPFYRECRNFERIDHWKVITKTHEYFDSIPESERRDSFRGWRSHHLHLSLSIYSPKNGLVGHGGVPDNALSFDAVNNFYFTPLAWQHFFAWVKLFTSAMSLPIRNGALFPDSPPPSPKFGKHLGTIKYRIDLEPLFITHQYGQFSRGDWARGLRTHVGVKARIGSFTMDMHQRMQEMIKDRAELGGPRIVFHKPFHEAEVSCETIDLKTIAAQIREDGENNEAMEDREIGENAFDDLFAEDVEISDEELDWVDMDDFVELDSRPVSDPSPKIRMFPTMSCPRFNYYRRVESKRERRKREMQDRATMRRKNHEGADDIEDLLERLERSKFGHEDTHTCMVGKNDKPHMVQRKLAQERLQTIRKEIDRVLTTNDHASSVSDGDSEECDDQQERLNDLHGRERILSGFIAHLGRVQEYAGQMEQAKEDGQPLPEPKHSTTTDSHIYNTADIASLYHDLGMFDNRFVAHNPSLFFSNATRTLLLKYYYSSRLRRGYVHHMTATAVRYIRDLLEKKDKGGKSPGNVKSHASHQHREHTPHNLTPNTENADGFDILHEMLQDTVNHMLGKDGYSKTGWGCQAEDDKIHGPDAEMQPTDGISDDFTVEKSNVCLLLKPQIVLRSDIDDKSTIIVSALRTRLQNYTVRDESCADDSVNATVLRRNFFALDSLQCFHPNSRSKPGREAHHRALKHGFVSLPLESLVDMQGQARDFERIIPHSNATMYYDKFNKLRLSDSTKSVATFRKDGKPVQDHLHHHMDMILLNCQRLAVAANSEQFAALYNVVTDLILYRDPTLRDHAKRLEEMMFSYDFTDVSGLADIVTALQVRIREAKALADQYNAVSHRLNERGRAEFVAILGEALELVEELNLIMNAITTSQDSKGGADREKKSALRFMTLAQEIAWNMMGDEAGQLLAKLAMRGISFSWLNKADNSAANTLAIQDLQALNVHPEATFAEIISKHSRASNHPMAKEGRFLDAMWSVLPPVGGIAIVDTFEFNLHPVRIQIELVVGRKIMDYIFGTKRQREKQEEEQKRIEDELRQQENPVAKKKSPFARLLGSRKHGLNSSSRAPSNSGSSLKLSATDPRSRSASSSDLLSTSRASSEGSREDDGDSVSGRASSRALATPKSSPKSRPSSSSNSTKQDSSANNDRPGDQFAIAQRNAAEMRSRAAAYRTFVYVKISETIFCLSYKGEKQTAITNLYDLVFKTPTFEYHNSTFGYVDLADHFKKDVFKAAWHQKSTLLRDIITHRPNRKRNAIESIRAIRQASKARESLAPLDISIDPPTPASKSSFDGSSHLAESPTETFSFRGRELFGAGMKTTKMGKVGTNLAPREVASMTKKRRMTMKTMTSLMATGILITVGAQRAKHWPVRFEMRGVVTT